MSTTVTGPGAPQPDQEEAARAQVRARFAARQAEAAARRAAQDEARKLRAVRRATRAEERRLAREDRADRAADSLARRAAPGVAAAVPVALVNATAFVGQFAYIREHVPWTLVGQVLVAATFESVAVYLAWHAHQAMMKNDSSTRLKLGAQLFALIMGAMNYSHYAVHWHPTVLAVGLGLMSLLSPSLWGVYSRRAARDRLMERGLVEEHAVRLGANRWTWHPLRSVQVMWLATWVAENDPKRAIALYDERQSARRASDAERRASRMARRAAVEARRAAPAPAPAKPALPAPAVPSPGAPAAQVPAGPVHPVPGTQVNGTVVPAIAQMKAHPALTASHPIEDIRLTEVADYLSTLDVSALPSLRQVARMLCSHHDHRRQAEPLVAARKASGQPAASVIPQRRGSLTAIATPVTMLPGGAQAHG